MSGSKSTRNHKIFVAAIVNKELDPTQPVKRELLRIKQQIEKALGCQPVMLQDLG